MSKLSNLHRQWSRDPKYRAAYDELGPELELARLKISFEAAGDAT